MLRRMRITTRLALLGLVALAVAAPALASTYTTGTYDGKTSQKNSRTHKYRKITLYADSTAGQVSKIKFVHTGKCNDGSRTHATQGKDKAHQLIADIDGNGHFELTAKSKSGATKLTMSGTIVGNEASGKFEVKSRFNGQTQELDPKGSIKCTTGKVTWSAKTTG
jgi:hypothetical protein